jgi:hypothetical protein
LLGGLEVANFRPSPSRQNNLLICSAISVVAEGSAMPHLRS